MPTTVASVDHQTVLQRILAYAVEGIVVALAAYFIPGRVMRLDEIASIGLMGAATFALLDLYLGPKAVISQTVRQGAGMGIGLNLVGFPA